MERIDSHLRYIDAERLTTPFGSLDGAELIGTEDHPVGRLDGVLVDPLERQVRYFVVASRGWLTTRHYLLTAGPARVERERNALRVDVDSDELSQLPEIRPGTVPAFSDDDLIAAIFSGGASH